MSVYASSNLSILMSLLLSSLLNAFLGRSLTKRGSNIKYTVVKKCPIQKYSEENEYRIMEIYCGVRM